MKKFNFPFLIFLIFASLFLSQKVLAVQKAYIEKIEYSISPSATNPYFVSYDGSKGIIAWVEDTNDDANYGKVYYTANNATKDRGNSMPNFTYNGGNIAVVNTNVTTPLYLYARYTVYNTGDDPIEGIEASLMGDYYGTKNPSHVVSGWKKNGSITSRLDRNGPLIGPSGPHYEIYRTDIQKFPNGYLWKPIALGWDTSHLFPNEKLGEEIRRPILRTLGTTFYPPSISCTIVPFPPSSSPSPASYCHWVGSVWTCPKDSDGNIREDIKINYGGTYKSQCTLRNLSTTNISYTKVNSDFETRLSWLGYLREGAAHNAAYIHTFPSETITLQKAGTAGDSTIIYREITINDSSSDPGHRNINFSQLSSSHTFYSCSNASCTQTSLSLNEAPVFGRGSGKYLGIDDSGTFSKTFIASNGKPAYKFYFNLFNPDTKYNEVVSGTDYDVDIQILKDGDTWYQTGSTAVFDPTTGGRRHYTIPVSDLKQDVPTFPGSFAENWSSYQKEDSYLFFYEIPDIQDLASTTQKYKLYITTIWKYNPLTVKPRTLKDEPMDQVVRSFVPVLSLQLSPVDIPSVGEEDFETTDNYIYNFSNQPLNVKIKLEENISNPNFSIVFSSNLCSPPEANTLCFTLNPGKTKFSIYFNYNGSAPPNDITGTLTGTASFQVSGGYIVSDSDTSSITIEKSAPPTANNLDTVPPNNAYCNKNYPPVTFFWTFNKPGDTQSAYNVQVDEDPNFSSPVATGRIQNSSNQCTFQPPLPQLSYGKNYYWRLKVWDSGNKSSDWIYPPNPLGQTTLKPGTLFQTTHAWPEPNFKQSPEKPAANEVVHFTDTSTCFDAECDSWSWDFGDGGTSNIQTPTHAFAVTGTPNVTLTVTDSDYYSCSIEKGFKVGLPLPKWIEIKPF